MLQPAKTQGKNFQDTGSSKYKSPETSKNLGFSWMPEGRGRYKLIPLGLISHRRENLEGPPGLGWPPSTKIIP